MPETETPPAPVAPTAPAAAPTPAATRPAPDPEHDDDEAVDGVVLTPQQQATRSRRRMERSLDSWKGRAQAAEAELAAARTQVTSLQAQVGSVSQLRTSLLQTAIRAEAATMIVPEAVDDAVQLLQGSDLTVGDDGKIDLAKVKAKLEEFVKARPYVAPQAGRTSKTLPGGHQGPPTSSGTHDEINALLRGSLRR
jgi:hypothetical protein